MFLNKKLSVGNTTFNNKKIKSLKIFYKTSLINSFLIKKSFILFYFYEILSKEDLIELKSFLNTEHLKSVYLKKNVLKKSDLFENKILFNNLIKNNVLLITSVEDTKSLNYKIIQNFQKYKKLHFLGGFLNKNFYRPSEIKKFYNLNYKNTTKNLIHIIKFNQTLLKNTLLYKK